MSNEFRTSKKLFKKFELSTKKIQVVQGGGDAAKTVTILQWIALECIRRPGTIATINANDLPNLKGGAMRSWERYVLNYNPFYAQIDKRNKSENTWAWKGGSVVEFKAFKDEEDARGSERDILFMNEANAQPWSMFWQLNRKTRRKTFLDYNPTAPFWAHVKLIGHSGLPPEEKWLAERTDSYRVWHQHNPFLTEEEHAYYENIADPDMFQVYSRGKTGKLKGLIFGHFKKILPTEWPVAPDRTFFSLDYGYTNDPTAIVKVAVVGNRRYIKELSYEPGIGAERIKTLLLEAGWQNGMAIYSEADPNMINDLRRLGLPVAPAIKGPGSIAAGISVVRQYDCYYTADSFKLDEEIKNYKWVTAQDIVTGKEIMTNEPVDDWNHLCDALRYGIYTDHFRYRTG